jgi:hypothetical protein
VAAARLRKYLRHEATPAKVAHCAKLPNCNWCSKPHLGLWGLQWDETHSSAEGCRVAAEPLVQVTMVGCRMSHNSLDVG